MEILWKGEDRGGRPDPEGHGDPGKRGGRCSGGACCLCEILEKEELYVKREGGQVEICCKERHTISGR